MFNFAKTTALVAALSLGTAAAANGTFGFQVNVEDDQTIVLDLVRAPSEGVVAIYDYSTGEFGDLIGTADLNAGANTDVVVPLDPNGAVTIAAVIYEGEVQTPDMAAGWIELDVNTDS